MPPVRRLLVGPHGPSLLDRLIGEFPQSGKGLWIVPTTLSRKQVELRLGTNARSTSLATVWTWPELWREVRLRRGDGPVLLSDIAARAIRDEAIARNRVDRGLDPIKRVLDLPGYRRQLRERIAAWTRAGLSEESKVPEATPVVEAEWRVFTTYRRLLSRLGLEDSEGMASWAAQILFSDPPVHFQKLHRLRIIEPRPTRDSIIALQALSPRAEDTQICLTIDEDRATLFQDQIRLRERILEWEFEEDVVLEEQAAPGGLSHIRHNLFREPSSDRSTVLTGVSFVGAPEGNGEALAVARRVRDLLGQGVSPHEILLVPAQESPLTQSVVRALEDWGISVESNRPVRLATDPALQALRLAASLPSEGWDAESLVHLLRNGRFHPSWEEASAPLALETAATAIREARAYRGSAEIREAVRRVSATQQEPGDPEARSRIQRASRAKASFPLLDRLIKTIERFTRPGTWMACVDRLFLLALELGLEGGLSFDTLRTNLEHHGLILELLDRDKEVWSWSSFTSEMTSILRESVSSPVSLTRTAVRIIGVSELAGVSTSHLVVFGLAEGTFSASGDEGRGNELEAQALARAMTRFLLLFSIPAESITLSYPVVDGKGDRLSLAGFLEDVRGLFSQAAIDRVTQTIPRIDGFLPLELAIAPNEKRVRAVARACLEDDFRELRSLARNPSHRGPLEAAARALLLAHWRARRERFGRFEGRLKDPRIVEKLTREFGPERRPFSASQLEQLAECPFKFFFRYVLGLTPTEDRHEFEEDYAGKGSILHAALEQLHKQIQSLPDEAGRTVLERVDADIQAVFDQILSREREPVSLIEKGLHAIDSERLRRTARRYSRQLRAYTAKDGQLAECRELEVSFGGPRDEHPALLLGQGESAIRIQGKIDRVDVVDRDGQSFFRIIDYKSGAVPSTKETSTGIALQLPLYVLAAERVIFVQQSRRPLDAGYWGLKKDGFKRNHTMANDVGAKSDFEANWRAFSVELEHYVLALVERSRNGDFPVSPRKPDCDKYCDYRHVCRIKGVRRSPKTWEDAPTLGGSS